MSGVQHIIEEARQAEAQREARERRILDLIAPIIALPKDERIIAIARLVRNEEHVAGRRPWPRRRSRSPS